MFLCLAGSITHRATVPVVCVAGMNVRIVYVVLRGFMTMGPVYESEEEYFSYFSSVKRIGDGIWRSLGREGVPIYSMGMSQSFAPAIKAGADIVRVGRRLFQK